MKKLEIGSSKQLTACHSHKNKRTSRICNTHIQEVPQFEENGNLYYRFKFSVTT